MSRFQVASFRNSGRSSETTLFFTEYILLDLYTIKFSFQKYEIRYALLNHIFFKAV